MSPVPQHVLALALTLAGAGCRDEGPGAMAGVTAPRAVVDRAYLAEALALIGGARREIMAVQFGLAEGATTARIEDALADAVRRGVRVRVLLDEEGSGSITAVPRLATRGVDAKLDLSSRRTHAKVLIADRRRLLFGSTNWSGASINDNHETNLAVDDERVAAAAADWSDALFSLPADPPAAAETAAQALRLCPDRSFEPALLALLRGARRRIDLLLYAARIYPDQPTSPSTAALQALASARARGVAVRVVFDRSDFNEEGNRINDETAAWLRSAGVPVRFDPKAVTTHAKLVLVDDTATVGSMNWGYGGFRLYHELSAVVGGAAVAELTDYYEARFAEAAE